MTKSGEYSESKEYSLISGVVNDKNIYHVKVTYFDNIVCDLFVNPEETSSFGYLRNDTQKGYKQVIGYSKDDKVIFTYD